MANKNNRFNGAAKGILDGLGDESSAPVKEVEEEKEDLSPRTYMVGKKEIKMLYEMRAETLADLSGMVRQGIGLLYERFKDGDK